MKAWPDLEYDLGILSPAIAQARQAHGRLLGKADALGAAELAPAERDLWSREAVATAAIEGEHLDLQAVRSSVARRLGLDSTFSAAVPRNVEGLLDVMEDGATRWNSDLTHKRLFGWQAALFPRGFSSLREIESGRYRSHAEPMQIVSGPLGRERVHYEAPPSRQVRAEMRTFLDWFNSTCRSATLDGIVRAGLSHVWFESIHPFEDGNGRVGRAIVDMALAQDARFPNRLHGISVELRREQAAYYKALNEAQRGSGDVTSWLVWFLNAFAASCHASGTLIDEALARGRFWSEHRNVILNERQKKVLNKMLEAGPGGFEGGLTPRKYQHMTRATGITATRDLADLVGKGLLVRKGAGRSTFYDLAIAGWDSVRAPGGRRPAE
jgi:Fic family protein